MHSKWTCGAKTIPMRCKDCGLPVYFFSCSCGCRVLFDSLGPVWELHDCESAIQRQEREELAAWSECLIRERYPDRVVVHLSDKISVIRILEVDEDPGYRPVGRHSDEGRIIRIVPEVGETIETEGVVRELGQVVKLKSDLHLTTHSGRQTIRQDTPISQLTIHSDLHSGLVGSYTAIGKSKVLGAANLVRHTSVMAKMWGYADSHGSTHWVVQAVKRLKKRR